MSAPTPPGNDDEAMSAIARVLGRTDSTSSPSPPVAPDGEGAAPSPEPSPGDHAADGPAGALVPAGPSSIVLRPKGAAAPVAVTRRHLYGAVAAGIVAAAVTAGVVATLIVSNNDPAPTAAPPTASTTTVATTSTSVTSTSTTSTSTTTPPTTSLAPPIELSTATMTLPVPQTKAGPTPLGAVARPGEDVLVPDQTLITGKDASWQWEHCVNKRCNPIKGATATYYRIPTDTEPGTKFRAALTIIPDGQTGRIKVRTDKVTVLA